MKTQLLISLALALSTFAHELEHESPALLKGAPGECTLVGGLGTASRMSPKRPEPQDFTSTEKALAALNGFPNPSEAVKARLAAIWELGEGKRVQALHEWIDELGLPDARSTDEEVFLIRLALRVWCKHSCEKESKFFYRHLYNQFLTPDVVDRRHLQHFLDLERHYSGPEDSNRLLIFFDAANGTPVDELLNYYPHLRFFPMNAPNFVRLLQNPKLYWEYFKTKGEAWEQINCRLALYDFSAILDGHRDKGIGRWRDVWGKDLPEAMIAAMELARERHEGKLPTAEQVQKVLELGRSMEPDVQGFLPRSILLTDPTAKPWAALDDPQASIFLMPDTSAVTLPQWDDALFGKATSLEQDRDELESLVKAAQESNNLAALLAFSLKEAEAVLPDNYWREYMGVEGYDSFHTLIETELLKDGIDIVITPQGPRFSMNDEALRAQSRQLTIALHRYVLKLAQLEHAGKAEELAQGCAALADLLNGYYVLWPLLINEYELRGVSAQAYVELIARFRGEKVLLHALIVPSGNSLGYYEAQRAAAGKAWATDVAAWRRLLFILEGAIKAPEEQKRELAAELVKHSSLLMNASFSQFVCICGYADVLAAAPHNAALVSGPASYSGLKVVKLALEAGNLAAAEAVFMEMAKYPRAYSYPCVRFAQAAIAQVKGDSETAEYAKKIGHTLAAWKVLEGGYFGVLAGLSLAEAGMLDEALRLELVLHGLEVSDSRISAMHRGFAEQGRFNEAAFYLERVLHKDCLTCTPQGGRSSEARLVRYRAMADAYRGLALLKEGKAEQGHALLAAAKPILLALDPAQQNWVEKKLEEGVELSPQRAELEQKENKGFDSPLYDWSLKTEAGTERVSARITAVAFRSTPEKSFVSLNTSLGRTLHVYFNQLETSDLDHITAWRKHNEIGVWPMRGELVDFKTLSKSVYGKIVAAGKNPSQGEFILSGFDVSAGEYVIILNTENKKEQYYMEHFDDQSRAAMRAWVAQQPVSESPLRLQQSWEQAKVYAAAHKLEPRAFMVGKRGGAFDKVLQETLIDTPEKIADLNLRYSMVLCYQDDEGKWDATGQEVMAEISKQILSGYPAGTKVEDTRHALGGFDYLISDDRKFIHMSLYPKGAQLPESWAQLKAAMDEKKPAELTRVIKEHPEVLREALYENGRVMPLEYAIAYTDVATLRALLEQGVKREPKRDPSLILACRYGRLDIAKLLLEFGADPNEGGRGQSGTALFYVKNNVEMARVLLAHGVDFSHENYRPSQGLASQTITFARDENALTLLKLYAEHGYNFKGEIDKMVQDAVLHCKPKMLQFVLEQGADVFKKNEIRDMYRSLANHGAYRTNPLNDAEIKDMLEVAEILYSLGGDINETGSTGWTVLDDAEAHNPGREYKTMGHPAFIEWLKSKGAENGKNKVEIKTIYI